MIGSGISGLLHLQLARANAASRTFAIDVREARLEAARAAGVDLALRADAPDLADRIRSANDGRLPERVIVCAAARSAMAQALSLVDDGGSVLLFAPLPPGETLALPVGELWKRGVTIVHSYAGPPDDLRAALGLIAARRVDVTSLITVRLGLSEAALGFRLAATGDRTLKVVLDPAR